MKMKLTIVTSLYKSEKFLKKFLKTVTKTHCELNSNGIDFEHLIILNDKSEIESHLIEKYKTDFIKKISIPRENLYATWNRGCNMANGEIITFWNVDDERNSAGILDGMKILNENFDLVYFPFIYKRYVKILFLNILVKIKKIYPEEFDKKIFGETMQCGPFFMFKKSLFEKVGCFDENFKIAGDFDWCIRASKIGDFKKSKIFAGTFHNNGQSLSGSKSSLHKKENQKIYYKYGIKK